MDPNQLMMMVSALQGKQNQDPSGLGSGMAGPGASIAATQQPALGVGGAHPQDMYGAMMQPPPMTPPPTSPF